jgi:hypothetical protein
MIDRHCSEFRQPGAIVKRVFMSAAFASIGALLVCGAQAAEGCSLNPSAPPALRRCETDARLRSTTGANFAWRVFESADPGRAALRGLAAGQVLRTERLNDERDRYCRLIAFAFVGEAQQSLQQAMLASARVSVRVGDKACATALLRAKPRRARPNAGFGPIQISPLCRPKMFPAWRPSAAGSCWSKARSCRCARAGPLFI